MNQRRRESRLHRHVVAATKTSDGAQSFNEWLLFYGGDVASQFNCCRKRQYVPLSESSAYHCDTCTTPRMSRAHRTYVGQSMANTAKRTYVRSNNNKKLETPWKSSDPTKG